jgi:NAD(P)-dependent dehydrogenase (short-subunit alcohol dehydrogenase family)
MASPARSCNFSRRTPQERAGCANGVGDISGRLAVVTGAASGIGRATALALAARGARLALGDVDEARLRHAAGEVRAHGRGAVCAVAVDVTRPESVERFRATVEAELGVADAVVNAAGVVVVGSFFATSPDDWDHTLAVNLRGPALVCRAFVPAMIERGLGGQIVHVASAAAFFTPRELAAYGATKHGLVGLAQALREELRPHAIGVSVVCPGFVDTPIVDNARFVGEEDPERTRRHVKKLVKGRGLRAERVAEAIVEALERGGDLVPVGIEAWALHALERVAPGSAARWVGIVRRFIERRR